MCETINHKKCLLLNADYSPLHIIDWKRALMWSMRYSDSNKFGIEIMDFYKEDFIQGTNGKRFPVPAVVKTRKYFKPNDQRLPFSRKNIYIRDNYTCQYCDLKKDIRELTYDHVVPRSLWQNDNGSPTSWTNIVTACSDCNRKKGNRTPKMANMPLKNLPVAPKKGKKYLPITTDLAKIKDTIPQEWFSYLPQSYL